MIGSLVVVAATLLCVPEERAPMWLVMLVGAALEWGAILSGCPY